MNLQKLVHISTFMLVLSSAVLGTSACGASLKEDTLPTLGAGLNKAHEGYDALLPVVSLICGQDAQRVSEALVNANIAKPEVFLQICAAAHAGQELTKDGFNTLVDIYDILNAQLGQE